MPAMPSFEPKVIARTHYYELQQYLVAYLAKCPYGSLTFIDFVEADTDLAAPANSRSTARQKLTRLTKQQFQELSTDVYDELIRRKTNTPENESACNWWKLSLQGPSILEIQYPAYPRVTSFTRSGIKPDRNSPHFQLRDSKISHLMCILNYRDVIQSSKRRLVGFLASIAILIWKILAWQNEVGTLPVGSPGSAYDDMPSPDFHAPPRLDAPTLPPGSRIARMSEDRLTDNGYGTRSLGRHPSEDGFGRHRPSDDDAPPRRSEDTYGSDTNPYGLGARKKTSQDIGRGPVPDFGRRPSASASIHSDSTGTTNAQSATATSGMIIPNKSTIAEEDIEVPYGREEARDSSMMAIGDRGRDGDGDTYGGIDDDQEHDVPTLGGLSALGARLRAQVSADALGDEEGGGVRSGEDYFDKVSLGRASVTSDRSASAARNLGGRTSVGGDDYERLRREYEFKIATMQSRIVALERDLGNTEQREKELREGQQRTKLLEEEIDGFRKVNGGRY